MFGAGKAVSPYLVDQPESSSVFSAVASFALVITPSVILAVVTASVARLIAVMFPL